MGNGHMQALSHGQTDARLKTLPSITSLTDSNDELPTVVVVNVVMMAVSEIEASNLEDKPQNNAYQISRHH